jgi:hypothetical protein
MQLVHESADAPLIEYDPALQGPVGALRPRDAQYLPGSHGLHTTCPMIAFMVPAGQGVHAAEVAPAAEYDPV